MPQPVKPGQVMGTVQALTEKPGVVRRDFSVHCHVLWGCEEVFRSCPHSLYRKESIFIVTLAPNLSQFRYVPG